MKYLLGLFAVAGCVLAQPVITAVQDGGAYTTNVAQGSVFVVKGTGLSVAGYVAAPAPAYPTTLNNVQITFTPTAGGAAIPVLMVYTYNLSGVNQLAAVLQSNMAAGTYNVRVINNGATSAPVQTTVVARKPGIVTASGDGTGQAQATIGGGLVLVRNSNLGKIGDFDSRPAHPGERIDLWGTGLGPDLASDTGGTSGDQTGAASIRVLVNGAEITPAYAGRSQGYPGLDQIVFILPGNVTLSCTVNVQVRSGGVLSNQVTIATAATGASACANPNPGGGGGSAQPVLTQSEIDGIVARGSYKAGFLSVTRSTTTTAGVGPVPGSTTRTDNANGFFYSISGLDLRNNLQGTSSIAGYATPADGVCNVLPMTTSEIPTPYPNLQFAYLDAGAALTLTGPIGSRTLPRNTLSAGGITFISYDLELTGGSLASGTYTFAGQGGTQVGSFSASVPLAAEIQWTNMSALSTVTRSSGMNVTWTGGDPGTLIGITGTSFSTSGGSVTGASFTCYANQSRGSFTVPASVLTRLPASAELIPGSGFFFPGSVALTSQGNYTRGTASGLDFLWVSSSSSVGAPVTFR